VKFVDEAAEDAGGVRKVKTQIVLL